MEQTYKDVRTKRKTYDDMVTRVSVIMACVSMQKWSSANVAAVGVVRRVALQVFQKICQRHGLHLLEVYSEGCTKGDVYLMPTIVGNVV